MTNQILVNDWPAMKGLFEEVMPSLGVYEVYRNNRLLCTLDQLPQRAATIQRLLNDGESLTVARISRAA